jgi:nucleoside-diphosphate-sugar epimerase
MIFAILGAGGFIGNRLAEYLILNDIAQPRPIVRSVRSLARVSRFEVDCRIADARDEAVLVDAIRETDAVFHCVVGDFKTNVESIETTYRACRRAKVQRLVYLSSAVVSGYAFTPGTDEKSSLSLCARRGYRDEYQKSKILAEQRLVELSRDGTVGTVVLRPAVVYGPRSTHWTLRIAQDLLASRSFLVNGGTGICNAIFVDNLVEAMVLCAEHPAASGHTFFVNDSDLVTWGRFYKSIGEAIGVDLATVRFIHQSQASAVPLRERTIALVLAAARSAIVRKLVARLKTNPNGQAALAAVKFYLEAASTGPRPDPQLIAMQTCRSRLNTERIERSIGYRPRWSFSEGAEKSALWLQFALGCKLASK